jgi:hypothetical protein
MVVREIAEKVFISSLAKVDFTLRRDKSLCISLYERENNQPLGVRR